MSLRLERHGTRACDPNVEQEFVAPNGITYKWDATDEKWVVGSFSRWRRHLLPRHRTRFWLKHPDRRRSLDRLRRAGDVRLDRRVLDRDRLLLQPRLCIIRSAN